METIKIGNKAIDEYVVRQKDTAITFDSGGLDILATPMLICSAERSCKNMVDPLLDEGLGTVGTRVDIRHLAPTPVGMKYWCESEITAIEGRMMWRPSAKGPTNVTLSTTSALRPRPPTS